MMKMCDNIDEVMEELSVISAEPPLKRSLCERCERPLSVCWCSYLPSTPIATNNTIVILQHPSEQKRCLRTAKILELSLSHGRCVVMRGKKFTSYKYPQLKEMTSEPQNSVLMYPGFGAQSVSELSLDKRYNIFIIDGTWSQSRSIYHNSALLHSLPKIELNFDKPSNYVIRTQPTNSSLSTVETAGIILAHLENDETIYEKLRSPLMALCSFQLERGAESHHSKEFLIMNGLYKKAVTKRIQQKLYNKQDIKMLIR